MKHFLNVNQKYYGPYLLYYYGYMACSPGWETAYEAGSLEGILIHYVKSGKGTFETLEAKYEVSGSSAFIMQPNKKYYYIADQSDPWQYMWICIGGDYIHDLFDQRRTYLNTPVIEYEDFSFIEKTFNSLISYIPKNNSDDELFYSGMINILLFYTFTGDVIDLVYHHDIEKSILKFKNEKKYINDATGYIVANYSKNITINDLAKYIGVERCYFSKIFKRGTGYTPSEYINNYRLEMAMHMLETSDDSIKAIAENTGFSYAHHFSSIFKEHTGKSPTQYRLEFDKCLNSDKEDQE